MLFSIVIGLMIFVYAAWTLVQFFRKNKKGKCASCEMNKSCSSACPGISALGKKRGGTFPAEGFLYLNHLETRKTAWHKPMRFSLFLCARHGR
ncbi:FeoB-associated Cys-rich membrane protein [Paenibacillus larvae]|nr:Virus attachment protein p12 family protein [Paenibacillus larvae subsp. larvae DSM 25430]